MRELLRFCVLIFCSYGGLTAVIRSPYFHVSLFLLVPTIGIWSTPGWWDLPIGILPNIISFTLAGYALFMGFGDEKFRRLMAGGTVGDAPMLGMQFDVHTFHHRSGRIGNICHCSKGSASQQLVKADWRRIT